MNYVFFIIKTALDDFRRNKIRTFLTSLGILIGVSSVVLLMAFGLGLKQYIKDQFESLGTNLIVVLPGQVLQGGGIRPGGGALGGVEFDEKDIFSLEKTPYVEHAVPAFIKTVRVASSTKSEFADLFATSADIFEIRNLPVQYGRLFKKTDSDKRSKVTVIGPKIAEKIYGSPDKAVNKVLKIDTQRYRIIGVLAPKGGGGFGGPDFDSFIYLPYKSAFSFNPKKTFFTIYLKVDDKQHITAVKDEAKKILDRRYNEDDFSVIEQGEILNAVTSIFSILNTVLVFIGAISLIVGGIGIMNIMYVSVVERTREVGIRRAIGATKKDILSQFLTESVILSLIGGLGGVVFSFVIVLLIRRVFPAYIDITSVIVAFGVSSLIGILFGVFPARKAANLTPVEAIRYE